MIEQHEFDLQWDGRRCLVSDIGAMQARQVARRVANVVGSAIREGADAVDKDVQIAGLIATGAVLEKLDDQTVEWLTQTFLKVTMIENEAGSETWINPKDVSNFAFGGGPGLARWLRWMSFCLEITCADFFRAALAEFTRLHTTTKKSSSTTSSSSPSRNDEILNGASAYPTS